MSWRDSPTRDDDAAVDRQIIGDMAGGSAEALGRLYDRHAGMVFALACRIVRAAEDAEEVVQDVFAQVWREASRYEARRASVAGWLVMITRARAIDRLRSHRARPDLDSSAAPSTAAMASAEPDPEMQTVRAADAHAVRTALAVLPERERQLVELAYFEGLTHSELAARTGTPLGTVKTRLRTAMFALRGALTS
ncbi:MAG: sigma-70 family RNA polymerase sigma factor [Vicinamibacterales bacterium]